MKQYYVLACSHDDRVSLGRECVQKLGQAQMRGVAGRHGKNKAEPMGRVAAPAGLAWRLWLVMAVHEFDV